MNEDFVRPSWFKSPIKRMRNRRCRSMGHAWARFEDENPGRPSLCLTCGIVKVELPPDA